MDEEQNIDQIYEDAMGSDDMGAMDSPTMDESYQEPVAKQQAQEPAPQFDMNAEYEYKARGRMIKEPLSRIIQRASQGYDYSQSMHEFKQRQSEFEEKQLSFDRDYKLYKEIDAYAKQNPELFSRIRDAYENRDNSPQNKNSESEQRPQEAKIPDHVLKELNEMKQFREGVLKKQEQERVRAEDDDLDQQVSNTTKQYPDLDFKTPDKSGKNLEYRVLEFATQHGIKDFSVAFKAYYHDEIVKLHADKARTGMAKSIAQKNQRGVVQTPRAKSAGPIDFKNLSYDELSDLGLQEYGLE